MAPGFLKMNCDRKQSTSGPRRSADRGQDPGIPADRTEDRVPVVEQEDLGHEVLGIGRPRPRVLLRSDEGALGQALAGGREATELDGPVELGLDQRWVEQVAEDDEAVLVPLLALLLGQHRAESSDRVWDDELVPPAGQVAHHARGLAQGDGRPGPGAHAGPAGDLRLRGRRAGGQGGRAAVSPGDRSPSTSTRSSAPTRHPRWRWGRGDPASTSRASRRSTSPCTTSAGTAVASTGLTMRAHNVNLEGGVVSKRRRRPHRPGRRGRPGHGGRVAGALRRRPSG